MRKSLATGPDPDRGRGREAWVLTDADALLGRLSGHKTAHPSKAKAVLARRSALQHAGVASAAGIKIDSSILGD
jgi:hypothetical protein